MYTVKNISFHCIGSGRIPFISLRGNLSVIITLPLFLLLFGTKILNPFPHDKILDQTKLKAFADDKLNVTIMIVSGFNRVDNIVGKGEIACTSNFSLLVQAISPLPIMFSKGFFPRPVKRCHCVRMG